MSTTYSEIAQFNQDYYDLDSTDLFYQKVSGGEHLHIGLFQQEDEPSEIAKERTIESMASLVEINSNSRVLDLGSGYGGTARFLVKKYGCHVTCLNISKKQNFINQKRNQEQKLSDFIDIFEGSFEELPTPDSSFDIVWSQDAIFHSNNLVRVFQEVKRTLVDGGHFIFSVITSNDNISEEQRQLKDFYSTITKFYPLKDYINLASQLGLLEIKIIDYSHNIKINYSRLLSKMQEIQKEEGNVWGKDFFEKMNHRLNSWIEAGEQEKIKWGFFLFQKQLLNMKDTVNYSNEENIL